MPEFDYTRLKHRIKECGYNQGTLAQKIGVNRTSLSQKIHGGYYPFKQWEIWAICKVLKIPLEEIGFYFFATKYPFKE